MPVPKHPHGLPKHSAGFTLLEAVVALLLLAVCLLPAANALRGAVQAPGVGADATHKLDCVSNLMEQVLAEPYARLLSLATASGASSYPSDDPDCPARAVTITRYGNNNTGKIGPGGTSDYLLLVSIALKDPADGNPFTLTTLVAR